MLTTLTVVLVSTFLVVREKKMNFLGYTGIYQLTSVLPFFLFAKDGYYLVGDAATYTW